MESKRRSINTVVEEQVKKWQFQQAEHEKKKTIIEPIITISREPGSGGRLVAEKLAEILGYDLFHQEVVHEMATDANISVRFMETLDERGLNTLENWIASIVDERYLWPDQYMQHLMKVVGTIGKHGKSIIVGRGGNFILQPETTVSARIIASFNVRCSRVAAEFKLSEKDSGRRIIQTESRRRSFIRKYFNTSISDEHNYDIIINTDKLGLDGAVTAIEAVVRQRMNG